ncbi:MAG: glycosyltransferase family 39 protein [Deltaproteobacteria bacterium]|nr:glycosyltransferase family 39 protein [Deltaproteobacteria bacterium]
MRLLLLATLLLIDGALLCTGNVSARGVAALLLFLLPGFCLGRWIFSSCQDGLARFVLALGCSFLFAIYFLFALQALPGTSSPGDNLLILNLLALASIWHLPRVPEERQHFGRSAAALVGLLVIASFLRLCVLGNAEFQGDEARAVILASGVSQGEKGILFTHKKGPVEALLVAPSLLLTGQTNEFVARLPFSLAGIAGILALFALLRSFDPTKYEVAALIAAALLCLDGFHVAFSRIVQYQSILVFLLLCAMQCAVEIRNGAREASRYLSACAIFCAGALLCHYDAALAFPAIAFVLWQNLRAVGRPAGEILRLSALPALQFIVLSAAFYAPFFLSEHFSNTAGYLSQRIGAHKLPTNNLPRYLELLSFYSGIYQPVITYGALLLGAVAWFYRCAASRIALVVVVACAALLILNPAPDWAFVFLSAPAVLLVSSPNASLAVRGFTLWAWIGLCVLGCFFARPNTHFYVAHPATAALAGICIAEGFTLLRHRATRIPTLLFVVALAALGMISLNYLRVAYVSPEIEYRFAHAKVRPAFTPNIFKDGLPAGAFFGFQHRSGWKVVGSLIERGSIGGSYDSNEEDLITIWYTRGMQRRSDSPEFYFIASRPMDPVPVPRSKIEKEYSFWGRVYAGERRVLDIYSRSTPPSAPQRFQIEDFESEFDSTPASVGEARTALQRAISR